MAQLDHTYALVHIVDVDDDVQRQLTQSLAAAGIATQTYANLGAFLSTHRDEIPGYLILDPRLVQLRYYQLRARFATLTKRERQVMALVTEGMLNKQIGGNLGVSEITVKVHRGSVMRKMGARSLAELVRMADALSRELVPLRSDNSAPVRSGAVLDRRSGCSWGRNRAGNSRAAAPGRAR